MMYMVLLLAAFSAHGIVDKVTNEFLPFSPGVTMVYAGTEDGKPTREEVQVLSKGVLVDGVRVTTVRDSVYADGHLTEQTDDFYAQDRAGNVWYLGEDSKAYERGRAVSTAGSWRAGEHGAAPGVMMLADPRVGNSYHQENAPKIAQDEAQVTSLNTAITVPYGRFIATVCTRETSAMEPGAREFKCYAKGVGLVSSWSGSAPGERLELERVYKTP
jgi:hypothetical protein